MAEVPRILSHHHTRIVTKQCTLRFEHLVLRIDPAHTHRTVGKQLTVIQSGEHIEVWHDASFIPFTALPWETWRSKVRDRKVLDAELDQRNAVPCNNVRKPTGNHPWRHAALT